MANGYFFIDCIYVVSFKIRASDQMDLEAAVETTAEFLNNAVKPVLMGGPKILVAKAGRPSSSWPIFVATGGHVAIGDGFDLRDLLEV